MAVSIVLGSVGVRAQVVEGESARGLSMEGGLRTRPELADRRNPNFQRRWGVG